MKLNTFPVLTALLVTGGILVASDATAQDSGSRRVERQTIQIPQPPALSWTGFSAAAPNMGRMVITGIAEGSPAEAAGLQVGDMIMAVDGRDALASPRPNFRQLTPGTEYRVRVKRGPEELELVLVPIAPPAEAPSR